jgi:hypothetical protein
MVAKAKTKKTTKFQDALRVVTATLGRDKELYYGYQSNIAMAFIDESLKQGSRDSYAKIHRVANVAACVFLNYLINYNKLKIIQNY